MEIHNPIPHHVLKDLYSDVQHPEQKIKYQRKKGILQPLINGWYLFEPAKYSYSPLHIANVLYGPSYVTGLTALSYLGWISDRTSVWYSAVFKRGKRLDTTIGSFIYKTVPTAVFHVGIINMLVSENTYVLMASPTKALYDHLVFTPNLHFSGKKDLLLYLEEDLRFDVDRLSQLSLQDLHTLKSQGRKQRQIKLLYNLVESLK